MHIKAPKNPFHNKYCSPGSGINLFTLTWLSVADNVFSFWSDDALVGVCLLPLSIMHDSIYLVFDIKQILKMSNCKEGIVIMDTWNLSPHLHI